MKAFLAVVLSIVVCIRADAPPPLPYAAAAAAAASSSYPSGYSSHGEDLEQSASAYAHQYSPAPEGFNIQSGYEGYLVPSTTSDNVLIPLQGGLEYLSHLGHSGAGLSRLLKLLPGKAILRFIPKIVLTAAAVVGVFLLGCALTTAVCTFTPFCTISFLGWGVSRETMRSLITEDRISATAAFVTEAIRKYQELYGANSRRQQKPTEAKN